MHIDFKLPKILGGGGNFNYDTFDYQVGRSVLWITRNIKFSFSLPRSHF